MTSQPPTKLSAAENRAYDHCEDESSAAGDEIPASNPSPDHVPQAGDQQPDSKAEIVDLTSIPPVRCPCGIARRAFAHRQEIPGTIHLTDITCDAAEHYHQDHTEVYVILECEDDAFIELDGNRHPVGPHTSVLIPPGVRHRACGEMKVLIFCTPNFDPCDEHFD